MFIFCGHISPPPPRVTECNRKQSDTDGTDGNAPVNVVTGGKYSSIGRDVQKADSFSSTVKHVRARAHSPPGALLVLSISAIRSRQSRGCIQKDIFNSSNLISYSSLSHVLINATQNLSALYVYLFIPPVNKRSHCGCWEGGEFTAKCAALLIIHGRTIFNSS